MLSHINSNLKLHIAKNSVEDCRKKYVWVTLLTYAVFYSMLVGYFKWKLPLMLIKLYTAHVSSMLFATINVIDVCASFIGGIITDRYGGRFTLLVNSIVLMISAMLFLTYTTTEDPVLVVALSMLSLGVTAISSPAFRVLIVEVAEWKHLGKLMSIMMISSRLGSAIGSTFFEILKFRTLAMLICCLVPLTSLFFIKEKPRSLSHLSGINISTWSTLKYVTSVVRLLRNYVFGMFFIIAIFNSFAHAIVGYYIPDYLDQAGVTTDIIALSYTVLYIGQAIMIVTAGYIADITSAMILLIIGNLTAGLMLLTALIVKGVHVAITITLFGILSGFHGVGLNVSIAKMFQKETLGVTYGFIDALSSIAFIVGPFIGGFIYDIAPNLLVSCTSILLTLCGFLALLLYKFS